MRNYLLNQLNNARLISHGTFHPPGAIRARPASASARTFCTDNHDASSIAKKRPRSQVRPTVSTRREGPFISKYYKLDDTEVENYFKRHDVSYRKSGRHLVIKECPFCHPVMGDPTNMYKLYVVMSSGVYMCHRCQAKGSWFKLRKQVSGAAGSEVPPVMASDEMNISDDESTADSSGASGYSDSKVPCPPRKSLETYQHTLNERYPEMKEFILSERGLKPDVLAQYGVGLGHSKFRDPENGNISEELCYMFPMFSSRRKLVRYKARAVSKKRFMKLSPKGGEWGLFGFDALPVGAKEVVLTEGEFDAMAVYQATGRPALSLPNGASSLPLSVVKMLERFQKIYLWMDDDIPGQEGARIFAKKLGRKRCLWVGTDNKAKDANDALLKGLDLESMIRGASAVPHEGVATFKDLRSEVYNQIMNPDQLQGVQSKLLPRLNDFLKGHRRGELSIFSGHTGTGKTTLLAQLSLDFCMQGQPTLWGSFEIPNARLARLLLEQLYSSRTGAPVGTLREHFAEWAERFEELPMYFMRYYGSQPIERVVDAMEYGQYVHDVSHVVLDNLQFMTSGQSFARAGSFGRFEVMDDATQKLRQFATEHKVHVSLVVHPRKENDDDAIQTASIFGSAKATQEADNVVILQRTRGEGRLLEVRKNRFDGSLGSFHIRFDKQRQLFSQKEIKKLETADQVPKTSRALPQKPVVVDRLFSSAGRRESSW